MRCGLAKTACPVAGAPADADRERPPTSPAMMRRSNRACDIPYDWWRKPSAEKVGGGHLIPSLTFVASCVLFLVWMPASEPPRRTAKSISSNLGRGRDIPPAACRHSRERRQRLSRAPPARREFLLSLLYPRAKSCSLTRAQRRHERVVPPQSSEHGRRDARFGGANHAR